MQGLNLKSHMNVVSGVEHFGDAGVYKLRDDLAIAQSVDFFAPIVDDPFVYGQIAAANALSDLYAVGATPVTALNLVGFPEGELETEVLIAILRGGAERVEKAGAIVIGGHSVRDKEVKFGIAVTGTVHPDKLRTNAGARAGDTLVLTKRIGTGVITTAHRGDRCSAGSYDAACASMVELNDIASRTAIDVGASAMTDITGFGLAGHAHEMAQASGVTIKLEMASAPLLPDVVQLAQNEENLAGAVAENRAHLAGKVEVTGDADSALGRLAFDPQTSGGLLISIAADRAGDLIAALQNAGVAGASKVGHVVQPGDRGVVVRV